MANKTLTLEVTVPEEAYDQMVSAICRAGGHQEFTEANVRATVLAWARRTVENVLASDAEKAAAEAVAVEKEKVAVVLDSIAQLSASQLEPEPDR